jgi:hypothetical protein
VKRYPLPVTFLAGALLLALVPADAAAQRRGGPAHGGRSVVVVRPAYGPFYYGGFYDPFFFGGVGSWTIGAHRKLGLRAGTLVGGGNATLAKTYGDLFGGIPAGAAGFDRDHRLSFRGRGASPITSATLVRVNDDFFIAEPQVNALLSLTKWMCLDAGVGYRLIGGPDLLGDDLRGISGSIAVQIGGR